MARYSLAFSSQATVATADTAALTANKYVALGGNSSTMQLKVNEIQCGGEATAASAVQIYRFGRDSTVAATSLTGTDLYNANLDATSTAPGTLALFSSNSTTKPQRSATLGALVVHSFNAYGGLVRWQARQGEEITIVGNTASLGECSYSGFTGTVASTVSGHIIYELV
jgi:hypothetical protein